MKAWMEKMEIAYSSQPTPLFMKDDILSRSRLVTISRNDHGYFIWCVSEKVVTAAITLCIKLEGNHAVLVWTHVMYHVKSLAVKVDSFMITIEHILKSLHGSSIKSQIGSIVPMILQCLLWIIDVELIIHRSHPRRNHERSRFMTNTAMNFKHPRTTTIPVNGIVLIASQRSHGKSIVIVSNMITKLLWDVVLTWEKITKFRRWVMKFLDLDFSTQAACSKFWTCLWGLDQFLCLPM
jgi:hypothetical protein